MTSISSRTHPELTPAERRAERARTEGAGYRIIHTEIRLRRKSDGKPGRIRFALVTPPGSEEAYTVRLRANGDACRCTCLDWTRRQERDGAAVEPCKHFAMVAAAGGIDRTPTTTPPMTAETRARIDAERALWD